jgi:hypothetical protein
MSRGGAAVPDHDHVEALIGEAADRGGDALVVEDPGDQQLNC